MALTDEEQRALAYQASMRRRQAFARFLQSKLKAPSANFHQLLKDWAPLKRP